MVTPRGGGTRYFESRAEIWLATALNSAPKYVASCA
jgi:hypothetical protein